LSRVNAVLTSMKYWPFIPIQQVQRSHSGNQIALLLGHPGCKK